MNQSIHSSVSQVRPLSRSGRLSPAPARPVNLKRIARASRDPAALKHLLTHPELDKTALKTILVRARQLKLPSQNLVEIGRHPRATFGLRLQLTLTLLFYYS